MSSPSPRHVADTTLLLIVLGLTIFGLMMVGSASSVLGEQLRGDPFFFFKHQLFYGGLAGLAVFIIAFFVPYRQWKILALPALLATLALLILVFIPGLQVASGGSARWIGVGPITIQPSELAKLAFILYLAGLLERKGEDIRDWRKSVVPFLVIMAIIGTLIVLQPDIGTLFIISVIALVMVYVAGFRLRHLALITLGGMAVFGILIGTARYRLARLFVYLHPELDPQGIGYQINQALLAVGTGGLWGLGFGRSRQKYLYLPEPTGDSIFAIIAEELGFIRLLLVLAAFAFIIYKGYSIAQRAPDVFGRLLAAGITTWIAIQAFINIGSILGLTPLTGIPLPFVSYGGSALATLLFAAGVLLNISKYTESSTT
jgi:cell division protein FtsW